MPHPFPTLRPKQTREALAELPGWQVAPGLSGVEGTYWLRTDAEAATLAAAALLVGIERGQPPRLQLDGRRLWICWPSLSRGRITPREVELARLTAALVPAGTHRPKRSRPEA